MMKYRKKPVIIEAVQYTGNNYDDAEIYMEHKQVAEWLKELKHYKDLEEQGRLIILPEDMDLKKLIKCTDGDGLCPRDVGLTDRCELSCLECWLAALKGAENDNL